MPIANCFIREETLGVIKKENLVLDWAELAQVDRKDITINIITGYTQLGNPYPVLVNLYMPTLWKKSDVERIQLGLLQTLLKHLRVTVNDIFIMTSLIGSGMVIENGQIIQW